jgi:putative DNA primase/helicase
MTPNIETTQQFFDAFKLPDAAWTFQTFDDSEAKRKNLISVRAGDIVTHYPDLARINAEGAGIFVTINLQTDPKKRNAKNTYRVTSLFVDFDGAPLPETWRLEPSLIIESSPGRYHAYWICSDILLEEFSALQTALATLYGGDPVCHDLPRVMRVPGFLHQKAEPFLSTIIHAPAHQYTRAEMLEAYPELTSAIQPAPPVSRTSTRAAAAPRDTSHYAKTALNGECIAVETAPQGERNNQLNRSAFSLGQLVAGGELIESEVISNLEQSALTAGLSLSEAQQAISSGLSAGKLQPRTAPPAEYGTTATAKIRHNPDGTPAASAKRKPNARGRGFTDYRDAYLDHLAETGTRIAHLEKNNSWWVYSGGVYKQILEATIMRWVDKTLEEHDLSNATLQNVISKLAREDTIHRDEDELKSHELNVANGILDLITLEKRDHTADFFSTVQTTASWDEHANPLEFKKFLEFAIPNQNERYLVQQYFGYCLTGWTKYQVALFLIGTGRTGKGTLSRVLQALLGGDSTESYAAAVSFEALESDKHQTYNLIGKRLAVVSEINKSIDWMMFKRITGEDVVSVNQKFKDGFNTKLFCKLLLLANTMPYLGEDSTNSSVIRRLLTVEMNNVPVMPDTTLETRLITANELSGILRWAVAGLHTLEKDKSFYEPENSMTAEMVEQSNRVITWLDECCHQMDNNNINATDVYNNYRTWCSNTNHRPVSSTRFKADLLAAGQHLGWIIEAGRTRVERFYSGFSLRVRFL